MSPIEMFVEGEAPAPEPHPRGGRRRLGPGRRCRGKKHLTLAFWAAPPPGPGSRCAGGPGERRQLGAGRRLPPPACCTLGSQPARQAARRARGRQPAASRERRALPTPCPPPPAPPRRRRRRCGLRAGGGTAAACGPPARGRARPRGRSAACPGARPVPQEPGWAPLRPGSAGSAWCLRPGCPRCCAGWARRPRVRKTEPSPVQRLIGPAVTLDRRKRRTIWLL